MAIAVYDTVLGETKYGFYESIIMACDYINHRACSADIRQQYD
jgi:hypothetical protein